MTKGKKASKVVVPVRNILKAAEKKSTAKPLPEALRLLLPTFPSKEAPNSPSKFVVDQNDMNTISRVRNVKKWIPRSYIQCNVSILIVSVSETIRLVIKGMYCSIATLRLRRAHSVVNDQKQVHFIISDTTRISFEKQRATSKHVFLPSPGLHILFLWTISTNL